MGLDKKKLMDELKGLSPDDRKTLYETILEVDPAISPFEEIKSLLKDGDESRKKKSKGKGFLSSLMED